MRLTSFIIAFMFMAVLVVTLSDIITKLGSDTSQDVNELDISYYNRMEDLSNYSHQTQQQISNVSGSSDSLFDIVGHFFGAGWSAAKTTVKSVDVAMDITNDAASQVALGENGGLISDFIAGVITVMIFIGIFLALILKDTEKL